MKYIVKGWMLALLLLCVAHPGWAQYESERLPDLPASNPTPAPAKPLISKEEEAAYKAFYTARSAEPARLIFLGEEFITKYPASLYISGIYSALVGAYLQTNQTPKMLDMGAKALAANPNDIDVLPILAWAIPRQVTGRTPDGPQQLQKAGGYARRAIELINTMVKPAGMDDASFAKAKNDKLSMAHGGLGVIAVKTGKYADAIAPLTAAVQLAAAPDMVDYWLLGTSNLETNHFTAAVETFGKCAVNGSPMAAQCKAGIEDAKTRGKTQLEAPK
jgi:tetratricopeptide (TPR) repeat protein